jgi:hypothetical protein
MRPDGRSVTWIDRAVHSMTSKLMRPPGLKRSSPGVGRVRIVQMDNDDVRGRERTRQ